MIKNKKWIIFVLVFAGFLILSFFTAKFKTSSIIAFFSAYFAVVKSKLFTSDSLKKRSAEIVEDHEQKQDKLKEEKADHDKKVEPLVEELDSLGQEAEKLEDKLIKTTKSDYSPKPRTEKEILEWLKKQ